MAFLQTMAGDAEKTSQSPTIASSQRTLYHNIAAAFSIIYLLLQCFLPYSHFLTPVSQSVSQSRYTAALTNLNSESFFSIYTFIVISFTMGYLTSTSKTKFACHIFLLVTHVIWRFETTQT